MGGWGAVLNYPLAAKEVSAEISANFGKEMARGFELNMARLGMLILDIRRGKVSDSDFVHGRVPRGQLLADPELQALLPVVGWGVIGASVWLAGRHLPATGVIEELESFDLNGSVDSLVTGLIRLVETHP
jgi:hypothetical protein